MTSGKRVLIAFELSGPRPIKRPNPRQTANITEFGLAIAVARKYIR
jgi:hypothetical protein